MQESRNHHHDHHNHHISSGAPASREELLALLSYMVSHNKHHAQELSELSAFVDGAAKEALDRAIRLFSEGNQELEAALECMNKN